jgi:hypothetical protein
MTVKAMHAVTLPVMAAANAVAVMAAVAAAPEASAVTVRKVAAKAGQRAALRAGQRVEATSAVNVVLISVANNVVNNAVRARRRVSNAHRASRVNHAKAVARSAHAVNAVSEAVSRAHRLMPPSKTLHWPTKPLWLRPWAAGQQTRARKPHAVSVAIAVAAMTAGVSHAQSRAATHKMRRMKIGSSLVTSRLSKPSAWTSMHLLKAAQPAIRPIHNVRRVSHASAAAVTVTAAIAANAPRVRSALKTALKPLL